MAVYITAIDPTIKRRVSFVVKRGWAVSIITGYRFKYKVRAKMKP